MSIRRSYKQCRSKFRLSCPKASVDTFRLGYVAAPLVGLACACPSRAISQTLFSGSPVSSGLASSLITALPQTIQSPTPSVPLPNTLNTRTLPPSAASQTPKTAPKTDSYITIDLGTSRIGPNQEIDATDVTVHYLDATITADRASGNLNHELVLSGHPHLESHDLIADADSIHAYPGMSTYRLENTRGVIDPTLLRGQFLDKLQVVGGEVLGLKGGQLDANQLEATSCIEKRPHYELRASDAQVFPHDRIVLHRVSFFLFGVKLLTVPYIVIPLNAQPHRPRSNYMPELGQNAIEGYYARIPYEFAERSFAATYLRFDITQYKGEGYRIEQEYLAGKQPRFFDTRGAAATQQGGFTGAMTGTIASAYGYGTLRPGLARLGTGMGPQSGGLFTVQGYFAEGFSRDFTASFRHQQDIGGDNHFSISTQLQNASSYSINATGTSNQNTQLNFTHADPKHGSNSDLSVGYTTNDYGSNSSSQLTGNLRQSWDFDSKGTTRNNFNYTLNYSGADYSSTSSTGSNTASIDTMFQLQHVSRDYSLGLTANKTIDLASSTVSGGYGKLEKLPELQFSTQTINYKDGLFSRIPLQLDIGAGRYSEPGHQSNTRELDDRVTFSIKTQDLTVIRGKSEMTTAVGFDQNFYSDTAAQYMVTNTTRFRQHLGGRSGIDLTYNYQQPEGATPFYFDLFNRVHNVTTEAGYLDDYHFQATLQTGYNFLKDYQAAPWQSVSARMLFRPNPRLRFDFLATYDINTGQWFNISNSVKIRAHKNLAIDLVGVYDPQVSRWSQVNSQFEIPLGRTWKVAGLIKYNGVLNQYQSTNFQITHEWDCMEASITYTANPNSFINDRQLFITVRLKALPFFGTFARGPAGQVLSSATNGIF